MGAGGAAGAPDRPLVGPDVFGGAAAGLDRDALETLGFFPTSFGLRLRSAEIKNNGTESDAGAGPLVDDDDVMVLAGDDDPDDNCLALGEEEDGAAAKGDAGGG